MRLGNVRYFCGNCDEIRGYLGHTGVLGRYTRYICGSGRCPSDHDGSISNIAKFQTFSADILVIIRASAACPTRCVVPNEPEPSTPASAHTRFSHVSVIEPYYL